MRALKEIPANQLLRKGLKLVAEHDDVVAVPADAAADVEHDLRHEQQDGADLVGHRFGRMIVPGVERHQHAPGSRVSEIELVRADRVALTAKAEELPFDCIAVERRIDRILEDRVKCVAQSLARAEPVGRRVLHAVGNPEVRHAGPAEGAPERFADAPARDAVVDPELSDRAIRMRQREALGFRMREVRLVEIEPDAEPSRPVDPAGKVLRTDGIAIDTPPAELAVARVQVEAMAARESATTPWPRPARSSSGVRAFPG